MFHSSHMWVLELLSAVFFVLILFYSQLLHSLPLLLWAINGRIKAAFHFIDVGSEADLAPELPREASHCCLDTVLPGFADSPELGAQAVWTSQGLSTQLDQGILSLYVCPWEGGTGLVAGFTPLPLCPFSTTASSPRGPHSLPPACWPLARLVVGMRMLSVQ